LFFSCFFRGFGYFWLFLVLGSVAGPNLHTSCAVIPVGSSVRLGCFKQPCPNSNDWSVNQCDQDSLSQESSAANNVVTADTAFGVGAGFNHKKDAGLRKHTC
jgi:hypothetical protein